MNPICQSKLSISVLIYEINKAHSPQPDVNSWWLRSLLIRRHCFYSRLGNSEVQSQSSVRVQLLWSVRPFLFRREFSKVSAKYFRQRNPAVKILLTFVMVVLHVDLFLLALISVQSLGKKFLLPRLPSPLLSPAAPHGSFEKWQSLFNSYGSQVFCITAHPWLISINKWC